MRTLDTPHWSRYWGLSRDDEQKTIAAADANGRIVVYDDETQTIKTLNLKEVWNPAYGCFLRNGKFWCARDTGILQIDLATGNVKLGLNLKDGNKPQPIRMDRSANGYIYESKLTPQLVKTQDVKHGAIFLRRCNVYGFRTVAKPLPPTRQPTKRRTPIQIQENKLMQPTRPLAFLMATSDSLWFTETIEETRNPEYFFYTTSLDGSNLKRISWQKNPLGFGSWAYRHRYGNCGYFGSSCSYIAVSSRNFSIPKI